MPREYFLLLSSFLIAPVAATAAEPHLTQMIASDQNGALTLSDAKALVAHSLLDSGQRMVRVGHAEFDADGNVLVEVVTIQGLPIRHVLVDGKTHQLAAVKSHNRNSG
jgi:hypothetical protein